MAEDVTVTQLPVLQEAVAGADVDVEEHPASGEAATLQYQGPQEALEPPWRRLLAWVGESGRLPTGPMREISLNDPRQVSQDQLLTDLVVPVR